jgi:hypothetical protein
MKIKIQLTTVWVLEKLSHTWYADGDSNVSVYTDDATDANFIELALDSLHITYEAYDYVNDTDDFVFDFDFRIEDFEEECSSFYQNMKKLDNNNLNHKNLLKN